MTTVGHHTAFEVRYRNKLKGLLAADGLLMEYNDDLAAIDLGLHLYTPGSSPLQTSHARVWMQAKGLRTESIGVSEYHSAKSIAVAKLPIEIVRYWYSFPEPIYLVVYVESADEFLAADIRELVDTAGGPAKIGKSPEQKTVTLFVPTAATLAWAVERMPRHRSMRIDGPSFRGRPLGHRLDPLRSELNRVDPGTYSRLVRSLLKAHDFRPDSPMSLEKIDEASKVSWSFGRLTYTYEWVNPLFTEFGYDEGSDFRIEGAPFFAQGEVLVIIAPSGNESHHDEIDWVELGVEVTRRDIEQVLVFTNERDHEAAYMGIWRGRIKGPACWPQGLGSLSFNVLVTTNVYLEFLEHLTWRVRNYL